MRDKKRGAEKSDGGEARVCFIRPSRKNGSDERSPAPTKEKMCGIISPLQIDLLRPNAKKGERK